MSVGPILIFDKSALQSLSVDEAVWLDTHYLANITPLFFVETLADLEKEVKGGRTPEQVVGNLAEKTPIGGRPNVHHTQLCIAELLGNPIEMRRVPVIGGGRRVKSGGRRGYVFEEPPEIQSLHRWNKREFLEVEREFALSWRQTLSDLNLEALYQVGKGIIERQGQGRPRDLATARAIANELIEKSGSRSVREALQDLLPEKVRAEVMRHFQKNGGTSIKRFAPYTAHVLTVDIFFSIALGADLISRERASNKIDIAYLYYLPFCMVFTSDDHLHAKTVPLFLNEKQVFVPGKELKTDLAKLNAHYAALPQAVKDRGVMSFAHFPPTEGDFLTSKLWDQLMAPHWRQGPGPGEPGVKMSPEDQKRIVGEIEKISKEPATQDGEQFTSDEADHLLIQHKVPMRRGSWRMLPPEVEKKI